MTATDRETLRGWGCELTPALLQNTTKLFAEKMASGVAPVGLDVTRDYQYGPDERHRLDIFAPSARASGPRPVLVFVHGGGFVRGDKTTPGSPFYDNIGNWAAGNGWVGVTMTYRLAPRYPWPSGAEDVSRAVGWIARHIGEQGGDPARIFLMGQSAGAVHVASYVVFPQFHGTRGLEVCAGILVSGLYDITSADRNEFQRAYFGADEGLYAGRSTLEALARSELPLLVTVSEFDPVDFQRQAALLVSAGIRTRNRFPRLSYLAGHNHLSSVLQFGLATDTLGPLVEGFVRDICSDTRTAAGRLAQLQGEHG